MNFYSEAEIEQMEHDFFGLTKKSRERIAKRRAARQDRKLEKIKARGDARAHVAAAGGGLANAAKGLTQGLGDAASKIFGGGAPPMPGGDAYDTMDYAPTESKQAGMGNMGMILMGALVLGAIVFAVMKKKNAA